MHTITHVYNAKRNYFPTSINVYHALVGQIAWVRPHPQAAEDVEECGVEPAALRGVGAHVEFGAFPEPVRGFGDDAGPQQAVGARGIHHSAPQHRGTVTFLWYHYRHVNQSEKEKKKKKEREKKYERGWGEH